MGTVSYMKATPIHIATPPGSIIKAELAERKISQKDFAKLICVSPSHLSDILKARRRINLAFAKEVEKWLGIEARSLLDLQNAYDIIQGGNQTENYEESQANEILRRFDEIVSISVLLKPFKKDCRTGVQKLAKLKEVYPLDDSFQRKFNSMADGCFRKSAKNGLDERMIATWVLIARTELQNKNPYGVFSYNSKAEVCRQVAGLLHANRPGSNVLLELSDTLSKYGILFGQVNKVDKASIDGFSFYNENLSPCIVVTCRYNRIDNLAFTLMHELGHIYLGHTTPSHSRINVDIRSINDEEEIKIEREADDFASEALIPSIYWKMAPSVPLNPHLIQAKYAAWADRLNLNRWIVLGRVSHETGMYKFHTDETRKISGRKEVRVG